MSVLAYGQAIQSYLHLISWLSALSLIVIIVCASYMGISKINDSQTSAPNITIPNLILGASLVVQSGLMLFISLLIAWAYSEKRQVAKLDGLLSFTMEVRF